MKSIYKIVNKAYDSKFYLWVLNNILYKAIPFNKPHRFEIVALQKDAITIKLPYKRKNLNHIKGIHACALATVSEYSTGFLLISNIDPSKYRLILKDLSMAYHYQGKTEVTAGFTLTQDWLEEKVYKPLENQESIDLLCEVKTYDIHNNHISTGKVNWQVKSWEKVKTKV